MSTPPVIGTYAVVAMDSGVVAGVTQHASLSEAEDASRQARGVTAEFPEGDPSLDAIILDVEVVGGAIRVREVAL